MTEGEMTVVARLVDAALRDGYRLSVSDGEEWTVQRSRDASEVLRALGTTDADIIRLWDEDGATHGMFYLVYGNDPDGSEVIADHTDNEVCEGLYEAAVGVPW